MANGLCGKKFAAWLAIGFGLAFFGCSGDAYLEPEEAGIDYRLQGEYRSAGAPMAAQVILLRSRRFRAVLLEGGLPGEGFDGETRYLADGRRLGERIAFEGAWRGVLADGRLRGKDPRGRDFDLKRVIRRSATLGAAPPPGATVLFAGAATEHLAVGKADSRGLLAVPARTAQPHGDVSLHVEFRIPFMPDSNGQGRGNSGIYLQERYEVQILDSFGLPVDANKCGAIYKLHPPRINMSYPPLQWQTYDIDFRAARYDAEGKKTELARASIRHNGVVIHDDVEISGPTGRGKAESPDPNPLLLQDHWDPVFYRNVWMLAPSP